MSPTGSGLDVEISGDERDPASDAGPNARATIVPISIAGSCPQVGDHCLVQAEIGVPGLTLADQTLRAAILTSRAHPTHGARRTLDPA